MAESGAWTDVRLTVTPAADESSTDMYRMYYAAGNDCGQFDTVYLTDPSNSWFQARGVPRRPGTQLSHVLKLRKYCQAIALVYSVSTTITWSSMLSQDR
jgi:hypothetical protein